MNVFNNHVFTKVEDPTLSSIDHSDVSFTPSACSRARVDTYVHTLFHIFSTGFGVDLSIKSGISKSAHTNVLIR